MGGHLWFRRGRRGRASIRPFYARVPFVARIALGSVWVYQGILPKLLIPLSFELQIIEDSRLYLFTPRIMLFLVGLFEAGIGIWILSGYRSRWACWSATAFMLLLQSIVLVVEPGLLLGPFGGIVKNIALVALAWIVNETDREGDRWRTEFCESLFRQASATIFEKRP